MRFAPLLILGLLACTPQAQIKGMPKSTGTGTGYAPFGGGDVHGVFGTGTRTGYGTDTLTAFGTGTDTSFQTGFGTGTDTSLQTGFGTGTSTGTGGPGTTLAFTDVANAVDTNCGGSSCHGTGAPRTVYTNNQAGFDGEKQDAASRISAGTMPPGGVTMPDADKQLILQYCNQ